MAKLIYTLYQVAFPSSNWMLLSCFKCFGRDTDCWKHITKAWEPPPLLLIEERHFFQVGWSTVWAIKERSFQLNNWWAICFVCFEERKPVWFLCWRSYQFGIFSSPLHTIKLAVFELATSSLKGWSYSPEAFNSFDPWCSRVLDLVS